MRATTDGAPADPLMPIATSTASPLKVTSPTRSRGHLVASGRAAFPSEKTVGGGRKRSFQVASGPHPVPADGDRKLNGREGARGQVELALRALEALRTHLRQARWLNPLQADAVPAWELALVQANQLGEQLRILAGKAGA